MEHKWEGQWVKREGMTDDECGDLLLVGSQEEEEEGVDDLDVGVRVDDLGALGKWCCQRGDGRKRQRGAQLEEEAGESKAVGAGMDERSGMGLGWPRD